MQNKCQEDLNGTRLTYSLYRTMADLEAFTIWREGWKGWSKCGPYYIKKKQALLTRGRSCSKKDVLSV